MKRTRKKNGLSLLLILLPGIPVLAGNGEKAWSLRECIDYARAHNIAVQETRVTTRSAEADLLQSKAARLPGLDFSSSQGVSRQKERNPSGAYVSNSTYTGTYSLSAGMMLYNGGKLTASVRQTELLARMREYETATAENDIEIAVTEAYLQILYANETLKTDRQTLESSASQLERTKEMYEAGAIAVSDYAQMEAQYGNDKYQVTVGENNLAQALLELKLLLELEPGTSFDVIFPELDDADVLGYLPPLDSVFTVALEAMPQIESSRLNLEASRLEEKIAAADRLPTVQLNAGTGTSHFSGSGYSFTDQLAHGWNQNAGITLSLPIFNNRKTKTAVEKARLQTEQARLASLDTRKELLRRVELLHQDVISARSRYLAATDKVKSASLSYRLVSGQFDAGMKNTVELLTEKNNFLAARQEQIQAKYQAVLSARLLGFYMAEPITL